MVILPPRSEEGWHKPPHPMLFVLLSGRSHVVTPHANGSQEVWIDVAGPNQMVLALDSLGKGHLTYYPSDQETVALQIPLANVDDLQVDVLHDGGCT